MKPQYRLLQLAVVGCRDACYRHDMARALAELHLALSTRKVLDNLVPEQVPVLLRAVTEYGICEDEIRRQRVGLYEHLVEKIHPTEDECAPPARGAIASSVCAVFDLGLARAGLALKDGDAQRGEIETDHVHNLPEFLDNPSTPSLDYYLEKERSYYLGRLEKAYGSAVSNEASGRFQKYWREMRIE